MSKSVSIAHGARAILVLVLFALTACNSDDETSDKAVTKQQSLAQPQQPAVLNYPYFNDLELKPDAEQPDAAQKEWHLGDKWEFAEGSSRSPVWHLDFGKPGRGLGSYTEGTARLDTVITIPETATYPALQFWHQLHLEKDNHSVVVEAQVVKEKEAAPSDSAPQDNDVEEGEWFVLRRFYESDNTDDYRRVSLDLTPYIGQSLRFRFRTVERSEKAEQASSDGASDTFGDDAKTPRNAPPAQDETGAANEAEKTKNKNRDAEGNKVSRDKNAKEKGSHENSGNGRDKENEANKPEKELKEPGKPAKPLVFWRIDDVAVNERDTDGDGIGDIFEIRVGTDPNDPDSVPADENHDGIPDVINGLMGVWNGACRYVGGGEYLRESFDNTEFVFRRRYESSAQADCRNPWNTVSKNYSYSLANVEDIHETGARLDLELKHVVVIPDDVKVAEALNRACSKQDFIAGYENVTDGVTCHGGVSYPNAGVVHYDLIRQDGNTIWVGGRADETDAEKRATGYAYDAAFQKAGT